MKRIEEVLKVNVNDIELELFGMSSNYINNEGVGVGVKEEIFYFNVVNKNNGIRTIWKATSINKGYPSFTPVEIITFEGDIYKVNLSHFEEEYNCNDIIQWINDRWLIICDLSKNLIDIYNKYIINIEEG